MLRTLRSSLLAAGQNLSRRVRARPDSEFQQALIRVGIGLVFAIYFTSERILAAYPAFSDSAGLIAWSFVAWSIALVGFTLASDKASPLRRYMGMVTDTSITTYLMYATGEAGAALIFVYLWVTLGNGFRYGAEYLIRCGMLSIVGFGFVVFTSAFWTEHTGIAVGMLLMLVLIPAYTVFLLKQLNKALEQAKAANIAKSVFLANMSHELRTPLNGVIGIADLLRETSLNKEQQDLTQTIHASAHTLAKLIDNVLDISRIEAGKQTQVLEDFDLHQLLNATVLILEPQAHKKGLLLASHVAPQTPYLLHGDVQHLRQVLINLIGNAVKFTEHGRVDVYVRPFSRRKTTWLRFEVVDSGIGIPLDMQSKIFESFTQADASITRRFGGTGLGTTISKQLVEMMGGEIGLVSQLGDGSTFWFEIPIQQQEKEQETLPGRLRVGTLVSTELGPRLAALIQSWNGDALPMNVPAGAVVPMLSTASEKHDALIVERNLLGNDPALFVRLLHDYPALVGLPVILVDQETSDHQDRTWIRAGYATVLHTPINPTLLFNALHEAASHKQLPENVVSLAGHFQNKGGRAKLRVMVAEDNPVNQRVMRGLLEHAGHEVVMAGNGEEALQLLESSADQFSLAIMDMHMPLMSGPEVVKRWRFMEKGHLPIIMLTADARGEAEQHCRESGADDFLTKPINSRMLMDKLASYAQTAKPEPAKQRSGEREAVVLDEHVLTDLAEVGGGLNFVRELIEDFTQDSERALTATQVALREQDFGAWKDQLHMLKGGASDVGALAMSQICAEAERIKPFEIALPIASDRLNKVKESQRAAIAALNDFLARQRDALEV